MTSLARCAVVSDEVKLGIGRLLHSPSWIDHCSTERCPVASLPKNEEVLLRVVYRGAIYVIELANGAGRPKPSPGRPSDPQTENPAIRSIGDYSWAAQGECGGSPEDRRVFGGR